MNDEERKKIIKEKEAEFYKWQDIWFETGDKEAWEQMFLIMMFVIETSIKKRLRGIRRTDFDDLVMEGTIKAMDKWYVKRHAKLYRLMSQAKWSAIEELYNKKQQQIDNETSYEAYIEWKWKKETTK